MDARHVDDGAAALHVEEGLLGEMHRAHEVDAEHALPVLGGVLLELLEQHHAGIVDQDIELAEALEGLRDRGDHLALGAHVAFEAEHIDAVLLAHALGRGLDALSAPGTSGSSAAWCGWVPTVKNSSSWASAS